MGAALLNETTPSGEAKIRLAVHCTGRRSAGNTIIYQQHTGGKQANSPSAAVVVERRPSRPGLSTVAPRPMTRVDSRILTLARVVAAQVPTDDGKLTHPPDTNIHAQPLTKVGEHWVPNELQCVRHGERPIRER